ncbi:NAD(P)H-hydrate dehydratase [Aidingimonas halophila]|uniref:Bifunctional NAD(P)H-hydrate repair enzyme n=1 Tax=Aidingimonas halophila TaxID=574349 RepID=A0A1H2R967_9GAMM|nr:NAD(P)H-hydrate dehydratase [Aidingimonas halophila]GHC19639.1 bifunctional NAD(P)H-hydrate repair enzyme Nnr [Aidingimonas halophila]SDW16036.1 NAD(P)H-hydrate epimerase [Aidingimonas halophila]
MSFPASVLYLAEQVRELDRRVIAGDMNGDGFALMKRAGRAAYRALRRRWPQIRRITVFCGAGNNAGDGYVVAALAAADGLGVQLLALRDPESLSGDAARAVTMASEAGVKPAAWHPGSGMEGEVIVDALLGTGLQGDVRSPYEEAIADINGSALPVLAIDIPSGLSADTGVVLGTVVHATLTVTFIADKLGLHTGNAPAYVGEHRLETLDVDASLHTDLAPVAGLLSSSLLPTWLPSRSRDGHKGNYGHVLVVGGAPGFGGAALLASRAAARAGAGKVTLATAPEHVTASLVSCPEVMVHGVRSAGDLERLLNGVDVVAVGPGLGQSAWGQGALQTVRNVDCPLVVDADGLNLLAGASSVTVREDWILTPHPGEAARLLGWRADEVQADRLKAVRCLQETFGGVAVLKGSGSLIAAKHGTWVCPYGNPGMASGGMGDVLTGIVAALVSQGQELERAACLGVMVHALAADKAAREEGERGLLASDLASYARSWLNRSLCESREAS